MSGGNLPKWFSDLLRAATTKAGSVKALSEKTAIPRTTIRSWGDGSSPGVHHVDTLLKFIGGDIGRAMPDWHSPIVSQAKMLVYGQVNAGTTELGGESQYSVPASDELWRSSRYWEITDGQTILLEVFGDSMFPQYRSGQLIACRRPMITATINDNTPVIFREQGNEYTFKLYRKSTNGVIVGEPINRDFPPVVFRTPKVEFIVLGTLDGGASSSVPLGSEKAKVHDFIGQAKRKKGVA